MADTVADEIRERGGTALANYDNIATEDGAQSLVDAALEEFGTVDGIVNNAGILRDGAFHKMSPENWDAVLKVHLYGGYYVTRAAWPHLREKKFGRIVMATSTSGLFGNFGQANYGAAKLGLVGLINTLAIEGVKYGILANAVAPMAATRMTTDIAPPELLEKLPAAQVAPVVGYLLSEQCTDTASVYVVGGGNIQRVAQFQNKGVTFAETPTVDELTARWSEISDLSNVEPGKNPLG
jgi:NAD(P)-dependent dehydrogenase (short-subunit alcohol dehydrogenase family)